MEDVLQRGLRRKKLERALSRGALNKSTNSRLELPLRGESAGCQFKSNNKQINRKTEAEITAGLRIITIDLPNPFF